MAINLASKFAPALLRKFTQDSILVGKTANQYDFAGVRSVTIYGIVTQALNDYSRTATSNRFGTMSELQDTVQELYLTQEKSFNMAIDRANKEDTMNNKEAGVALKAELDEVAIPHIDKYGFAKYFYHAGHSHVISAPAAGTIVGLIADGLTAMDNALVPDTDRFIYIGATYYNILRLSTEILAVDPLAVAALGKGVVATFMGYPVVKVPDTYFPTNCYFIIMRKQSIELPIKFRTLRVLTESENIDGSLLQGHFYFDAFVLGERADGIYAAVNTAVKCATPTFTAGDNTIASTAGSTIYYTTDGSDPRYSKTAATVATGGVLPGADATVRKCAGFKADMCWSDVATITIS